MPAAGQPASAGPGKMPLPRKRAQLPAERGRSGHMIQAADAFQNWVSEFFGDFEKGQRTLAVVMDNESCLEKGGTNDSNKLGSYFWLRMM